MKLRRPRAIRIWYRQMREKIYAIRRSWDRWQGLPAVVGVEETPWLCNYVRVVDDLTGRDITDKIVWVDQSHGIIERFRIGTDGDFVVENGHLLKEMVATPCHVEWVHAQQS